MKEQVRENQHACVCKSAMLAACAYMQTHMRLCQDHLEARGVVHQTGGVRMAQEFFGIAHMKGKLAFATDWFVMVMETIGQPQDMCLEALASGATMHALGTSNAALARPVIVILPVPR